MTRARTGPQVAVVIACLALLMGATGACAQDSVEERWAAARRYMSVVPMEKMVNDSVSEIAKQLPDGKRAAFVAHMQRTIRIDVLEQTTLNAMVKIFTVEELNALADFWASKAGKAAMDKFGLYMAEIMPTLQQELQRAMQQQLPPR